MKTFTRNALLAIVLVTSTLTACKKSLTDSAPVTSNNGTADSTASRVAATSTTNDVAYPTNASTKCQNAPNYGDSIIFLQPSTADYIIKPVNHPDSGTYFSWPQGMVIDINSGAINVTKSEGGLRYNIGYVKKGTRDTCLQTLVLGGASYADSLYVLSDKVRYAPPYFNSDPSLVSICDASGGPGGNHCRFDVNDQAAKQYVVVDHKTGLIDLKNTVARAFGPIPLNGTKVTTTIAYELDDKSNLAPQKITVQLIYYNKKSDVPADLMGLVSNKLSKILNQVLLINLPGSSNTQFKSGNPRPPIIIVSKFAF